MNRSTLAAAFVLGACAPILAAAAFLAVRFEATYTDASGSRCIAVQLTEDREADLCSGRYDRSSLAEAFPEVRP